MPQLFFHNTLTRRREAFRPIDPANVRVYLCGPTVYDRAHIGNARNVVMFDILVRLLRKLYPRVTYVRNITDIDDKINARAKERGVAIEAVTEGPIRYYHEDMGALYALPPDIEPRATDHLGEIIDIIQRLIANGHAYEAEGHVLFAVASDADYGKFSGRSLEDLIAGARRGRAVQARCRRFRAVETLLRRPAGLGQPLGARPPGLAYRMLGHVP